MTCLGAITKYVPFLNEKKNPDFRKKDQPSKLRTNINKIISIKANNNNNFLL